MRRERLVTISITLPPSLARRARIKAAEADKSRSQFVREILAMALAHANDKHGVADE